MWPTRRSETQAGFSLLEILVAFAIMATVVTVLLQVFAGGLRNLRVGEDYAVAATLAESRLAELGRSVPVVEGEEEGAWDRYGWQVRIAPWDGLDLPDTSDLVLYEVAVTVHWRVGTRARSLTLNSLRPGLREGGGI